MTMKTFEKEKATPKEVFKNMNACFCTNSTLSHNSLFPYSFARYAHLIDDNFLLIPGTKNGKPFYGLDAFLEMIVYGINKHIDYFIYIDEDAFYTKRDDALAKLFLEFAASGKPVGGCMDGGALCHRNHNPYMINTFVSFWNVSAFKKFIKSSEDIKEIYNYSFSKMISEIPYDEFSKMFTSFMNDAFLSHKAAREKSEEVPYCNVVRNDPDNKVEPHQVPYSWKLDDFEPYYKILSWIMKSTKKPMFYLDCKDLAIENVDPGISSLICYENEPLFVHTWFSRQYGNPSSKHHKRIKKIINEVIDKM